jgi:hypothetical protein
LKSCRDDVITAPGGGLGGLARGYLHAASPRLRKGEEAHALDAAMRFSLDIRRHWRRVSELIVMRARNSIVLGTVVILAGAAAQGLSSPEIEPVKVRLVETEALGSDSKAITLDFAQSEEPGVYLDLDGYPSVQLRLANRWQAPLKLPKIEFLSQLSRQRIVLAVPCEAQACRILIGYRVYQAQPNRPYSRVYCFLQRHGLRANYPKISGWVLKCFAPRLRRSRLELTLPEH